MSEKAAPGWYYADGDPPGTIRFWNGVEWIGAARPSALERRQVHGRQIANPGRRIGAAILDGIILAVFAIPAVIKALRGIDWDAVVAGNAVVPDFDPSPAWSLGVAAFSFLYTVGAVAMFGATPGKLLMKIEVIRQTDGGTPPGWMTAFVRYSPSLAIAVVTQTLLLVSPTMASLVSNLALLIPVASLVLVFSDQTRRSIYDLVARTNVVDRV